MPKLSPADSEEVTALFQRINLLTTGCRTEIGLVAMNELLSAMIIVAVDTPKEAQDLAEELIGIIRTNIVEDWDHYRAAIITPIPEGQS